ncbi:unnamed protein product [Rhizopus stolonifer]
MLYWPRLLIIAYSITLCLDIFIPFYLYHESKLNTITISAFVSIIYLLRSISAVWSIIVNFQPNLYGRMITALILLSSLSYISIFTLIKEHHHPAWTLASLGFCSIFNGLFYQPLGILINGAIIKTLGDYRALFYGSYLRWRDITCILTTGAIGLTINATDEDYLGVVLLVIWIIGMFSLSIIALSSVVKPATSNQLNISDDQAPLLLKNARNLTADQGSICFPTYRPYSIFGEQLSHISEEDDSILDRIITTEDSLRHVSSYDSNAPSFYSRITTTNEELHHYYSRYTEEQQTIDETHDPVMVHAYALALLPLPSITDPLVALLSKQDDEEMEEELFPRNYYGYSQQNNPQLIQLKCWKMATLNLTLLLLGTTKALLNTFLFIYVYSSLGISIADITFLIIVHLTFEMLTHFVIEKWYIHKMNLTFTTTFVHISLILCSIIYPALKPNYVSTHIMLVGLQTLQGKEKERDFIEKNDFSCCFSIDMVKWSGSNTCHCF